MSTLKIDNKNFGITQRGVKKTAEVKFRNQENQRLEVVNEVACNEIEFEVNVGFVCCDEIAQLLTYENDLPFEFPVISLEAKIPASSDIYADQYGNIKNSAGQYYTTDQGYGLAGYTDANGRYYVAGSESVFVDENSVAFTDEDGNIFEDAE